jgi:hypothetical protein
MADWNADRYKPLVPTALAAWDNYEIYDLVLTNVRIKKDNYLYTSAIESTVYTNQSIRYITSTDPINPLGITNNADPNNPTAESIFLSYGSQGNFGWIVMENYQTDQTSTPESLVFIDTVIDKFKPEIYAVQRYTIDGAANTSLIYTLFDEYRSFVSSPKISWKQLIIDKDIKYTGIAQVSGVFILEYWSHNYLEGHPQIDKTLDYRKLKIRLIKGKQFSFTIYHPVAHSLVAPTVLHGAIPAVSAPLISDILATNRNYASTLLVPVAPVDTPPTGYLVKKYAKKFYNPDAFINGNGDLVGGYPSVSWNATNNPLTNRGYTVSTYAWVDYRVLRAANRVPASTWGTNAIAGDYPAVTQSEIDNWHFNLQFNNDNGSIIMDSIRTIETLAKVEMIASALDAEKYSTNSITAGDKRVTNIGWLVENSARVLGLRFTDDGKIDIKNEKENYLPATLNNPQGKNADEYALNSWGTKGMFVSFMPTTYDEKGREEKLHDVVHDIPQLIQAKERALNKSIGIQHGSEIRMHGSDGKIQSYPNQLALMQNMARGIEKTNYIVQKLQIALAATSMEVRDLYSGIGIPVSTKFITLSTGTDKLQIPYVGYQKDKPAILNYLIGLQANVAITNGILLPKMQAKKTSVVNPFKKFSGD